MIILISTISVGALGYVFIERWSLGDAIYMTIISLTTTGFQEVRALSPAGRALTVFIIVSGIPGRHLAVKEPVDACCSWPWNSTSCGGDGWTAKSRDSEIT